MVSIRDPTQAGFNVIYYLYKQKFGDFITKAKIGNLLAIADTSLNVILLQSPNWK